MDILFENTYVRDKELAKEYYMFCIYKRLSCRIARIIWTLADLIGLLFLNPFVLALDLVFCLARLIRYYNSINKMVNWGIQVHGKEIEARTVVTDTYFERTLSTGAVTKVELKTIKQAVQTKNLILLRSDKGIYHIFRKDTFTIGTKNDFIAFLINKGITVTGK